MSGDVEFEWDENKREATLQKHGIDFKDAVRVFGGKPLVFGSSRDGEVRFIAIGPVNEVCIAVVFTMRAGVIRIVTARRARTNERQAYDAYEPDDGP